MSKSTKEGMIISLRDVLQEVRLRQKQTILFRSSALTFTEDNSSYPILNQSQGDMTFHHQSESMGKSINLRGEASTTDQARISTLSRVLFSQM